MRQGRTKGEACRQSICWRAPACEIPNANVTSCDKCGSRGRFWHVDSELFGVAKFPAALWGSSGLASWRQDRDEGPGHDDVKLAAAGVLQHGVQAKPLVSTLGTLMPSSL